MVGQGSVHCISGYKAFPFKVGPGFKTQISEAGGGSVATAHQWRPPILKKNLGFLFPIQQNGSYWDRALSIGHLCVSNPHRGDSLSLDARLANPLGH